MALHVQQSWLLRLPCPLPEGGVGCGSANAALVLAVVWKRGQMAAAVAFGTPRLCVALHLALM